MLRSRCGRDYPEMEKQPQGSSVFGIRTQMPTWKSGTDLMAQKVRNELTLINCFVPFPTNNAPCPCKPLLFPWTCRR